MQISGGLYEALVKRSNRIRAQRESKQAAQERLGDLLREQKEKLEKPPAPLVNKELQTDQLSSVFAKSRGSSSDSDDEDFSYIIAVSIAIDSFIYCGLLQVSGRR